MLIKSEILCKKFVKKRKINDKIIMDKKGREYYVIPVTHPFTVDADEELFKLNFQYQQLWIKYSNQNKQIYISDCEYDEFILIQSMDIIDIHIIINTDEYFIKNIWNSKTQVTLNKKYNNMYFLILPIFSDRISVKKDHNKGFNIMLNTTEILLRKTYLKTDKHSTIANITSNFLLHKSALFIPLKKDIDIFFN